LHEAADERVSGPRHDDRNGRSHRPRGARSNNAFRQDDVDSRIHQHHSKLREARDVSVAPLRDQHEIASLHPAAIGKAAQKRLKFSLGWWRCSEEPDPSHPIGLLRARRERPSCRRASEQGDELY